MDILIYFGKAYFFRWELYLQTNVAQFSVAAQLSPSRGLGGEAGRGGDGVMLTLQTLVAFTASWT